MKALWRIELLGGLRVQHADRVITRFPTQKTAVLLAYLAYHPQHPHPRDALIEQLWPEIDLDAARASLRNALYSLRQLLEPAAGEAAYLLIASRSTVSLHPDAFTTDVAEFRAALQSAGGANSPADRAAQLSGALAGYRGELLPGYHEPWILQERRYLAEAYLEGLHHLVTALEQEGELERAVAVARQAVSTDPLRDEAHFDLMRLYAAAGQPSAVLRQYQELERLLTQELGAAPSAAARALVEELRQRADDVACRRAADGHQASSSRQCDRPSVAREPGTRAKRGWCPPGSGPSQRGAWSLEPGAASPPFHRNLPIQLTRFIGRSREMAEVQDLLVTSRLLTLTGAGGCGKTRLALEVASQTPQAGYPRKVGGGEGIWLVELAPLSDPERLPQAIATVLELPAEPEPSLTQTLVEHLKPRRLLLLLDNCEHLLAACAHLVERVLRHCPQVRILATSREGLGLPGEQIYRVPSLLLPDARDLPPLERLQEFEAVSLFADRAALSHPGFAVTQANAPSVVQICRQLDGMPLAIELAAARLRVMDVEQLAARLDDRFRLLTGGSRTALPRQQTLRATLDWSYELLSQAERALLRGLSVFAGGFTLEAAEAVCAFGAAPGSRLQAPGSGPSQRGAWSLEPGANIIDQLLGLVEKSLVGYEPQRGDARYRLLETVRQYAWEQLGASGERVERQERHCEWYLQLAERGRVADPSEEREWLVRLEREIENFRAALRACHEAAVRLGDRAAEAGLRLASALSRFWICRGYLVEGLDALETALADGADLPAAVRAPALAAAGNVAGTLDAARAERFRQQSRDAHETVLQGARQEGTRQEIAATLFALVETCFWLDDLEATWTYGLEARRLMEELGDPVGLARVLELTAGIPMRRGDLQTARALLEERLRICRKLGTASLLVHALGGMGHLERDEGNYGRAQAYYQESLVLRRDLGDKFALAQSLEDLAVLAGKQGQGERTIRLLGATEAFCETLGTSPPVCDAAAYQAMVAEGRARLSDAPFAALWADGRALSLEQAIDFALETSEA